MNALSNQEFGSIQGGGEPGILIVILKSIFIPLKKNKSICNLIKNNNNNYKSSVFQPKSAPE